ncbi:MAG TPA: FtsX-like permease family protein, partial [Gemmatimonadaceae bacterium]|nr:FtsX-like permease family protein [Gemmatimonadaceae bacterium]
MAALTWPGESALGKCLIVGVRTSPCRAVVGVAGDVHRSTILEGRTLQYYLPLRQSATTAGLLVRLDPARLGLIETQIRSALSGAIPPRATLWMKTLDEVLDPELRPWRLGAILFGGLSILALVVAAIGVYSVIAYAASQRLHEMGIRIALGAQVADLLDLIVAGGLRTLVLGILGGLVAAVALGRLVASMLFGVTTHDPAVLIGAATALLALGSTSCVIAGWRAAHVDPAATLRSD